MTRLFDETLEFITPAFLAGADPARAEIRPASIRGELRWWFRALGGTHEQESSVFGSVHGGVTASAVIVRAAISELGRGWSLPDVSPNSGAAYVWHFAKASASGTRWQRSGFLPPGTKWHLQVLWKRSGESEELRLLRHALAAFLAYGALGLRATRGLGAFLPPTKWRIPDETTGTIMRNAGFLFEDKGEFRSLDDIISTIGLLVKGTRKKMDWINDCRRRIDTPSPMGGSHPRQASAIRFRPVKTDNGLFRLIVYEAPHDRILGQESKRQPITGQTPSKIVFPPPLEH